MIIEHVPTALCEPRYFNGILAYKSRAPFTGRILVRPGARKRRQAVTITCCSPTTATANTKPQLEIYPTTEVHHGATSAS